MEAERIDVVVALIEDATGRLLISRRPPNRPMAGYWEFPGGKRAAGETRRDALARELYEELGIRVVAAQPFLTLEHDYPALRVALDVWSVTDYEGCPVARERQELQWVEARALSDTALLPADWPIVERLLASGLVRDSG